MQELLKKCIFFFILSVVLSSCMSDDTTPSNQIYTASSSQVSIKAESNVSVRTPDIIINSGTEISYFSSWNISKNNTEIVTLWTVYDADNMDKSAILINDLKGKRVFLMDKQEHVLHEWTLWIWGLWNDFEILPDGKILALLKTKLNSIETGGTGGNIQLLGGAGGHIQLIDTNWKVSWDFTIANNNTILHHDVELLTNGNILAMEWNRVAGKTVGYKLDTDIFLERLIEINPKTNAIVWEWRSRDHILQDTNPKIANYGNIEKSPERIDINYSQSASGMVMHANWFVYDPVKDLIYLSVYNFSEVWVIDHSTTRQEARGSAGGTYERWGDLVYRFGNPSAYRWSGTRLFYSTHHPSFTHSGTFLIYSNGKGATPEQSTVYELQLPEEIGKKQSVMKMPEVVWSYTHPDLYFDKVGWAVRLPNGNTLITEWDGGIWEVTREKKLVWKYTQKPAMFWRTYSYSLDSPAIKALELDISGSREKK